MNARIIALLAAFVVIGGSIYYLESGKVHPPSSPLANTPGAVRMDKAEKAKRYTTAKELAGIAGTINADRVSVGDLVGKKVILIDFWTYSCINCQRTTPYLNAWYDKYRDKGLEIIGVHTPEFEFEKKYGNVRAAVEKFKIKYPVALDNDYATWQAYGNRYWPHKYLIDIDGYIVYDHIGEGSYEETEKKIQELLRERTAALGSATAIGEGTVSPKGVISVDSSKPRSPEIYFGAARNQYLGNGTALRRGRQHFIEPKEITLNTLYLVGDWDIEDEFARAASSGAKIIFRYEAQAVYIVASADVLAKARLMRDRKSLEASAGEDVKNDMVSIHEDRLYKLVEDAAYGEHTLEITIDQPGLRTFTFTFG